MEISFTKFIVEIVVFNIDELYVATFEIYYQHYNKYNTLHIIYIFSIHINSRMEFDIA